MSGRRSSVPWICAFVVSCFVLSIACSSSTRAADEKNDAAAASAKPLASEELNSGATLDIVSLDRHGDGLVSLVFRLRNPGKELVKVLSWDAGRDLPSKMYLIDEAAKSKYTVAKVKAASTAKKGGGEKETLLAARVPMVELKPGESMDYWVKFAAPAELTKATLFFPDAPPMDNLPIGSASTSASSSSSSSSASDSAGSGAAGATIASQSNTTGARVEVTQVRRTGDGFVEIRWRYVNPGKDPVRALSHDDARDLMKETYVIDPATKKLYGVVTDTSGEPVASKPTGTDLSPDKPLKLWARFPVAASATQVSLYLPQTLPLEDMPIEGGGK